MGGGPVGVLSAAAGSLGGQAVTIHLFLLFALRLFLRLLELCVKVRDGVRIFITNTVFRPSGFSYAFRGFCGDFMVLLRYVRFFGWFFVFHYRMMRLLLGLLGTFFEVEVF